jgi:predicted methyltransferase
VVTSLHVVLSHVQVAPLLQARREGRRQWELSPDLGLSQVTVALTEEGVLFPSGELLRWDDVERIASALNSCFLLEHGSVRAIQTFSSVTNRPCSLYPTQGAPSLLIAGFVMHRVKEVDPLEDTRLKMRTLAPIGGRVLDTATGLGYTAIEAARHADEVITIELDPAVQEVARFNPWSQDLFHHPKIRRMLGDASELVPTFPDQYFSRIIHDPPAFDLAGELYSGAFYRELYRVLRGGGRLFHYVGDLQSRAGSSTLRGVTRRLQEAGFARVVPRQEAFGVVAYK